MIPVYFDKINHRYYADEELTIPVPSLSHILHEVGMDSGLENVPLNVLKTARQRGSAVHLTLELFDNDDLADALIYQPYVDSWKEVKSLFGIKKFDFNEQPMRSEKYDFACKPDRAYKDVVVEIKTGFTEYPKYRLQTAGQGIVLAENLGNPFPNSKRFAVHFDKNGKYKIIKHDDDKDYQDFITCVEFYHVKKARVK